MCFDWLIDVEWKGVKCSEIKFHCLDMGKKMMEHTYIINYHCFFSIFFPSKLGRMRWNKESEIL
ncbi:hypothetical protein JHK82_030953 [Glycine max]|nr:hypothetical protein JHK82_030953 [Glycine max]KAG5145636.1 hypothetical protein JHK84_031179 [Glycine max]